MAIIGDASTTSQLYASQKHVYDVFLYLVRLEASTILIIIISLRQEVWIRVSQEANV